MGTRRYKLLSARVRIAGGLLPEESPSSAGQGAG